jgi:hypothetical protein
LRPQPSSLALRTRPAELRRRSPGTAAVPRPSLRPRRVRSLGKLRRITRGSGRPLIRPFLLWCARFALTGALLVQLESRCRRPTSSLHPSFCSCVPGTPLKVTVLARPLFPLSRIYLPAIAHRSILWPTENSPPPSVRLTPRSHKTDPAIEFARPSPTSPATRTDPSRRRRPSLPRLRQCRRRARVERRPWLPGGDKTPWRASNPPKSNRTVRFQLGQI